MGVIDSKKLTQERELLFSWIILLSSDYGIGQSSVKEIEKFGIRFATELSMLRALGKLKKKPSEIIIDGPLLLRPWKGIQNNIISGDSKFTSIAAASIVAKVSRDRLMERLDKKFSGYFISKNKGYGTKAHFERIQKRNNYLSEDFSKIKFGLIHTNLQNLHQLLLNPSFYSQ